jgi:hypothetical protein
MRRKVLMIRPRGFDRVDGAIVAAMIASSLAFFCLL